MLNFNKISAVEKTDLLSANIKNVTVKDPLFFFQFHYGIAVTFQHALKCNASISDPGESPVPPPSTVSSSALSTSAVAAPPQPKPGNSSQQDRKVPPPIGTERLARIRQTGSVNPPLLTTGYTASVGQGGIWSYGVGTASGKVSFF